MTTETKILRTGTKVSFTREEEESHQTYSFSWIIPKFLDAIKENIREFRTVKMSDLRPQLKLQVWGHNRDIIEVSVIFPTSVLTNGTVVLDAERIRQFDFNLVKENNWHHLATLYKRDIEKTVNDCLRSNGDLRLKLNFKVYKTDSVEPANENKLGNNLQKTLNNSLLSDVIMKSNGGKEYKVHKVILASRSVVLKAHFEHGTTECLTNIIESPFDSDVLEEVLSYIYSDHVTRLKDFPKKLLAAADYYQLNGLKNMCEEELSKELGLENAMEMLQLAISHQAVVLKKAAVDCVKKMKFLYEHVDCTDWDVQYCTYDTDDD